MADFVAEVRDYSSEAAASILGTVLTIRSLQSAEAGALTHDIGYARHGSAAGGGRATSFASRRRFCAIAARVNSSCAPHGPAQPKPPQPQDAFEMSKQHLDGFAMAARSFESLGLGQGTSNVASILIHIAHDPARRHIRTAFWFEHAGTAVRQRRQVTERMIRADMAGRGEHFASWAEINVPFLVESEVFSRESPILAL